MEELLKKRIFEIKDVPQSQPCLDCKPCMRFRLMEMGLTPGEKIEILGNTFGLWRIQIIEPNGSKGSQLALREEEMKRILFEEGTCPIGLE
jgi:Fe2+ transport system protein FeoA